MTPKVYTDIITKEIWSQKCFLFVDLFTPSFNCFIRFFQRFFFLIFHFEHAL